MRYSDVDLIHAHDYGDITIEPFTPANLSVASYDLTLGRYLLVPKRSLLNRLFPRLFPLPTIKFNCDKNGKLTVIQGLKMCAVDIYDRPFVLRPGQFVLGSTHEYVGQESKSLDLEVSDKSTLARCGLSVCFSAGYVDPGNALNVTLEIYNHSPAPIELQYRQHIAQGRWGRLSSATSKGYNGKYKNSESVVRAK